MSDLEIVWTKVDEAPGLATFSLLPIVEAFAQRLGKRVVHAQDAPGFSGDVPAFGIDQLELILMANPGEPARPLAERRALLDRIRLERYAPASITDEESGSPDLNSNARSMTPVRVWMCRALAHRNKSLSSLRSAVSKISPVTTRMVPMRAPAASSSVKLGNSGVCA